MEDRKAHKSTDMDPERSLDRKWLPKGVYVCLVKSGLEYEVLHVPGHCTLYLCLWSFSWERRG